MTVYSSNISVVLNSVAEMVATIRDTDAMLRTVATTTIPLIRVRVHVDGNDSDNQPIGNYSDPYLKVRQGVKYNRTADPKVILSLTRQMENDLSVIDLDSGYGIGYKNEFNYQKSQWLEEKYKKNIFQLSKNEIDLLDEVALNHVKNAIN